MSMIKFPYTNLHELNLDWLIEKVKECYSPDNPPDDVVLSVNGDVGDVILYKEADVQLPDIEDTSWNFFRLADGSAVGIKFNKGLPLERVYGSSRFAIYDAGNPPPYPVTSVNGQTGAITIQIAFGSLTGDTVSFLTSSPAHSWSLDRETLDGSASIRLDTTNNEISAYIEYVSSDDTVHSSVKLLTPADIPSSSGVLSVNGAAGVVVITAEDIHRTGSNTETVEHCLSSLTTDTQNLATKIGSVGSTSLQAQVNTINGTLADIQEDIGSVGSTSLQSQVDTINGKIGSVGSTSLQDQVDALNTQVTPTYATVTLESGITGTVYIMRMGKLRVLTGYVNPNNSGAAITIATLPAGDKPPVDIRGSYSGFGVTATGEFTLKASNGVLELAINATPSNTIKFNITYAVA